MTDALEASALDAFGTIPARAVLAARPRIDLLLFSGQNVSDVINWLANALQSGELGRAFLASVDRVMMLRASLGA